jgi:hypothetical protein
MYSTGLRVGRQLLDRQPAPLRGDELLDGVSAMRRRSVPYDQEPTRQMAQQMVEEIDYLGPADGAAYRAASRNSTK